MNTQTHRTCIRMSQEEYDLLKKKSRAAGLSANAWLMRELERNRPILYREKETRAAIAFADEAGRDINAVARAFNSGCGTAQQLGFSIMGLDFSPIKGPEGNIEYLLFLQKPVGAEQAQLCLNEESVGQVVQNAHESLS